MGPVGDGVCVYIALTSGQLVARNADDGHEIWRVKKDVTGSMAVGPDGVFVATSFARPLFNNRW